MAFRWGYCGGKAMTPSCHVDHGHTCSVPPAASRLPSSLCPPRQQDPPPPGTWGGHSGRSGCRAEGRRCCSAALRAPPSSPQTSSPQGEGRNCRGGGRGAEEGGRESRRGDLSFWKRCSCATRVLSLSPHPCVCPPNLAQPLPWVTCPPQPPPSLPTPLTQHTWAPFRVRWGAGCGPKIPKPG